MGKALYRKYRSKKLSEIVGQEHVTTALENALKNGRIGHAYLFTGPRGVGKTSIARILAHEVNGLPYDESTTHLDIIEIDAASNRRIDEIRTLRERVHNAPTSAKYKVYIIDEVHMLTKEAFNALLKTLEEPPAHVIFILATTEAHKLPETIISRTQRYTFKPAEKSAAVKHLKSIAKTENIDISDEALELVAAHGRGSFRDSISLLDQIGNTGGKVEIDDVRRSLGIAPDEAIRKIMTTLANGTATELINQLTSLHGQGYQAPQIAKQLGQTLRQGMLDDTLITDVEATTELMQKLIDIPAAHDPFALLEITLLAPILARDRNTPSSPLQKTVSDGAKPIPKTLTKKQAPHKEPPEPKQAEARVEAPKSRTQAGHTILDESSWQQILHTLKQQHNTLYGIARMAVPLFEDGKLTLCFSFPFHQKRFNEAKNTRILSNLIREHTGTTVSIECIVDKQQGSAPRQSTQAAKTTDEPPKAPLDTISNIFGGGEILE